jgi:hypothetical protein
MLNSTQRAVSPDELTCIVDFWILPPAAIVGIHAMTDFRNQQRTSKIATG